MDTTAEVSLLGEEEEQSPCNNVEDVTYEFVKTGKSKGEGIRTTHDGNFKVLSEYKGSLRQSHARPSRSPC